MPKVLYTRHNAYIALSLILVFSLGLLVGKITNKTLIIKPQVLRESGYKYINPILLCNLDNLQEYNEEVSLTKKLNSYIKNHSENKISIYFLELGSGRWSSINESFRYSPASMLKVPTMVDALKYAESNPLILEKKVYYDGSFDNNMAEFFKPEKSILPNKYYTIDELLTFVIQYSDNNALTLIHKNINEKSLQELYKDLHIEIPANTLDFMNAKTYALFLRVLYNSTYLRRDMSEKAIKLMLAPDFPNGLQAGLPKGTEIAQKFGERQVFNTSGNLIKRELHDCGIVYKETSPYIICVMTDGNDFEKMEGDIRNISKIVSEHLQVK